MRKIILLLLILSTLQAKSQHLSSEVLYNKIVMLYDISGGTSFHGTGFILKSGNNYTLITAKHVTNTLQTETAEIYFRDSSNIAIGFKIKQLLPAQPRVAKNENSDFIAIDLKPFDSTSARILKRASLDAGILSNNRESLKRNIDVLVFGYPIYDLVNFSPITFKSNFSSSLMNISVVGLEKPCYCYLLENPSMGGFSGGPVFAGVEDRQETIMTQTTIIGIVTGTTVDKTGGKFAIITPSFHLLDLITE